MLYNLLQVICIYTKAAGCCWDNSGTAGAPCFAPKIYGYNFTQTQRTPGQTIGTLDLIEPSGIFSEDFENLAIYITQETATRTHIKITVPGSDRWEVPEVSAILGKECAQIKIIICPQIHSFFHIGSPSSSRWPLHRR